MNAFLLAATLFQGATAAYANTTTVEATNYVTIPCSTPTTFAYGSSTFTVTEATTLTVEDCSCTHSVPHVGPATAAPNTTAEASKSTAPGVPVHTAPSSSGVSIANSGMKAAVGLSAAAAGVAALLI